MIRQFLFRFRIVSLTSKSMVRFIVRKYSMVRSTGVQQIEGTDASVYYRK
jgi:hypothetical protein